MKKIKNKITINDVAKKACVSKATVSRYLNGKYDMLSDITVEKVKIAVEELGFRPNKLAQSLKSNTSGTIGCIVSNIGSPFSSILVKGINHKCLEEGYQLILTDSEDNANIEKKAIENLLERSVDGLIINSTGENDEYFLKLAHNNFPIVLADRPLSIDGSIDTVITDNENSLKQCMQYLHNIGYTKVALFSSSMKKNEVRRLRYYAFCKYDKEIFKNPDFPSVYFYNDLEDCRYKIRHFIGNFTNDRLAIIAINGVSLLDVLNIIIKDTGIKIGRELGICGFDNWGWADLIGPGITTITQNTWDVGYESAKLLFDRINNKYSEDARTVIIKNILETRGSTVLV